MEIKLHKTSKLKKFMSAFKKYIDDASKVAKEGKSYALDPEQLRKAASEFAVKYGKTSTMGMQGTAGFIGIEPLKIEPIKPINFDNIFNAYDYPMGTIPFDDYPQLDKRTAIPGEHFGRVITLAHTNLMGAGSDSRMKKAEQEHYICLVSLCYPIDHRRRCRLLLPDGKISNPYVFHHSDIEMLPVEFQNIKAAREFSQQNYEKMIQSQKEAFDKEIDEVLDLIKPNPLPFNQINFTTQRLGFNTSYQIMQMVCETECGGGYIKYNEYHNQKVDEVVYGELESGDFLCLLPVEWVGAIGYTEEYVKRWVDFLNRIGFEVPVHYDGIMQRDRFSPYPTLHNYRKPLIKTIDPSGIISKNEYYGIRVEGGECGGINYPIVKMIYSLYHTHTNQLPGLAMQIKDALDSQVNEFEAFMMACLNDWNGIFAENIRSSKTSRIVNVFAKSNSAKNMMRKIESSIGKRLSQVLNYVDISTSIAEKLRETFTDKRYEDMYTILKEVRGK